MDLRTKSVSPTAFLHLKDADGELMYDGKDKVGITFHSPGTKEYTRANAAKSARLVKRMQRRGKQEATAEENIEENGRFFADCTVSFHHIERDDLQGLALYRAVYLDIEIGFIAEQVSVFLNDWSNFSQASAQVAS